MANINLKKQFETFKKGIIIDSDGNVDECFNFYNWFCRKSSLERKANKLYKAAIRFSKKFNLDEEKYYMFFKNNCPLNGPLYDDFRICDIESGDVIFTVIPKCGHSGLAEVWGKENGFKGPIYEGKNLGEIYKKIR